MDLKEVIAAFIEFYVDCQMTKAENPILEALEATVSYVKHGGKI